MPRRFIKQFIYGAFFTAFWLALLYGAWLLIYKPSCADHIKNQGEAGIDCGGPCAPCGVRGQPLALSTFWFIDSKTFRVAVSSCPARRAGLLSRLWRLSAESPV